MIPENAVNVKIFREESLIKEIAQNNMKKNLRPDKKCNYPTLSLKISLETEFAMTLLVIVSVTVKVLITFTPV